AVNVDVRPAVQLDDRERLPRQRAAGEHEDPLLQLHRFSGNASCSMNLSLKSSRSESSTYSTSSSSAVAACRSCIESSAIFAPSPATLPAETMRGRGSRGTSPIRTALAADRYEPKEPASSTCWISD